MGRNGSISVQAVKGCHFTGGAETSFLPFND